MVRPSSWKGDGDWLSRVWWRGIPHRRYRTNVWTVATLADRLRERYGISLGPWALRQRMKRIGLVRKRPRYFYHQRAPHVAQKKGGDRAENEG